MAKSSWKEQFKKSLEKRYQDEANGWGEPEEHVVGEIPQAVFRLVLECTAPRVGHFVDVDLESPIEEAMYWAMVGASLHRNEATLLEDRAVRYASFGDDYGPDVLLIEPQVGIGKHRVDFRLTHSARYGASDDEVGRASVLVECDGHDYHERTKAQAKRDRSRDRELMAAGHQVLRFTGSEIWDDPFRCADQAVDFVASQANKVAIAGIRNRRDG